MTSADHPALSVARAFIDAVIWGEHSTVWDLLSPAGRNRVLLAGSRGGLDSVMAERIRQGTSPQSEMDEFLSGLVRGLRFDLASSDLEEIEVVLDSAPDGGGEARVMLEAPAPFSDERWPVGSLTLSQDEGGWVIDKLDPRRIKR